MSRLFYMITVVDRDRFPEYAHLFSEYDLSVDLITRGLGTASSEMQELFGLEDPGSEKVIIYSVVTSKTWKSIKKALETNVSEREPWAGIPYVNAPWTGISFIIPMSSVGGEKELKYLTRGQSFKAGEESVLKDTLYELIIAVTNSGYSDMVMDAARDAGATGGTIIHARGTSKREEEEFLGITLASEKDMVYIVSTKEDKNKIMQSIMKEAGMDTKARSMVFSLPVTETSGLKLTKERVEKKEKAASK